MFALQRFLDGQRCFKGVLALFEVDDFPDNYGVGIEDQALNADLVDKVWLGKQGDCREQQSANCAEQPQKAESHRAASSGEGASSVILYMPDHALPGASRHGGACGRAATLTPHLTRSQIMR
jgi:hypothetical protein